MTYFETEFLDIKGILNVIMINHDIVSEQRHKKNCILRSVLESKFKIQSEAQVTVSPAERWDLVGAKLFQVCRIHAKGLFCNGVRNSLLCTTRFVKDLFAM